MGITFTSAVNNVINWCRENISEQDYWMPSSKCLRIGGAGWEVRSTGTNVDLYVEDEATATFLALKYGVSVRFFYRKNLVDNQIK